MVLQQVPKHLKTFETFEFQRVVMDEYHEPSRRDVLKFNLKDRRSIAPRLDPIIAVLFDAFTEHCKANKTVFIYEFATKALQNQMDTAEYNNGGLDQRGNDVALASGVRLIKEFDVTPDEVERVLAANAFSVTTDKTFDFGGLERNNSLRSSKQVFATEEQKQAVLERFKTYR